MLSCRIAATYLLANDSVTWYRHGDNDNANDNDNDDDNDNNNGNENGGGGGGQKIRER